MSIFKTIFGYEPTPYKDTVTAKNNERYIIENLTDAIQRGSLQQDIKTMIKPHCSSVIRRDTSLHYKDDIIWFFVDGLTSPAKSYIFIYNTNPSVELLSIDIKNKVLEWKITDDCCKQLLMTHLLHIINTYKPLPCKSDLMCKDIQIKLSEIYKPE